MCVSFISQFNSHIIIAVISTILFIICYPRYYVHIVVRRRRGGDVPTTLPPRGLRDYEYDDDDDGDIVIVFFVVDA